MDSQHPDRADEAPTPVYHPPVIVSAGSFRVATRGGTQLDYEVRIGKKAN